MLEEALKNIKKEGLTNRINRYKKNGTLLKKILTQMGLDFQLSGNRTNLMINVYVPDGFTYNEIHDKLKEKGYIFYPYKKSSKREVMHIGNIGTLTENDIIMFCNDMETIINEKNS